MSDAPPQPTGAEEGSASDNPELAQTIASDDGVSADETGRSRPSVDDLCGCNLHHFRVDDLIGQGGMGKVFKGHDLSLDRPVALKVVPTKVVEDITTKDRFVREARAQARLSHPNVVQIHYIGEQNGLSFFAMELIEGESLDDLLRRGERLEWSRALDMMIEVAEALELARSRGIIHRDIKPSNLLLDRSGRVKVADFGLAKWVAEDVAITQKGHVLGTPHYMSPEQAQGEVVDHRSDIYSLGATFYHLVAGHPPFSADTPMAIVVKQITQPLTPLRTAAPEVPDAMAGAIDRMMAKSREQRFDSYGALIAALKAAKPQVSPPAGVVVRSLAFVVDLLLMAIFIGSIGWLFVVPYLLYQVLGWWRRGQTVGKWLFRLQVRSRENTPASFGSCLLRALFFNIGLWIALGLSILAGVTSGTWTPLAFEPGSPLSGIAALGMASSLLLTAIFWGIALFRRDRRGLYDLLARTAVFYRLER